MKPAIRFFTYFLVFFAFTGSANAATTDIAYCGASYGHGYTAYRGLVNEKDAGWDEDKISEGKITLQQKEDGEFDILGANAMGGVFSSLSEGANIIVSSLSEEAITLVSIYPNQLVETYVFQTTRNGKHQVMWTQAKAETIIPRITAFVAECTYLNLKAIRSNRGE